MTVTIHEEMADALAYWSRDALFNLGGSDETVTCVEIKPMSDGSGLKGSKTLSRALGLVSAAVRVGDTEVVADRADCPGLDLVVAGNGGDLFALGAADPPDAVSSSSA